LVGDEADFADPLSSLGVAYQTIDLTIPEPPETEEIPPASPETLAEGKRLLQKAADATGGAAAWASVKDMTTESEVSLSIQGMQLSVAVEEIRTADGKDFVSQVLPFGEVIMARTAEGGWKKTPQGIEDLTPDELEEMREGRSRDLWEIFRKIDEVTAQALPAETIVETEADRVLLSGGGLEKLFVYLDQQSGEPLALRYKGKSPMTGAPVQAIEVFSDFRSVGPVKLPHAVEVLHDGETFAKGIIKTASVNTGVDPAKFAKPE
jgi:hypothetical protein